MKGEIAMVGKRGEMVLGRAGRDCLGLCHLKRQFPPLLGKRAFTMCDWVDGV